MRSCCSENSICKSRSYWCCCMPSRS